MADDGNGNGRISVSRDALRAELAEMELRLRAYFDTQLANKVDQSALQGDNQRRWTEDIVYQVLDAHERRGWTRRERGLALLNICMTVAMLVLSVVASIYGIRG